MSLIICGTITIKLLPTWLDAIVEVCEVWDYLKLMAAEVMIETCLLNIGCFLTLVASSKLLLTKTTFPIYIPQINKSDNTF